MLNPPNVKARRAALSFCFFFLLLGFAHASGRIVAIGDVHGDLEDLTLMLRRAGLVSESGAWIGGDDTLVQTGDLLDRGPGDAAVLDAMMRLQQEAVDAGGRVVVLLGNHEAMNLTGDLRYVNPEVYEGFADQKSERRRAKAYKEYARLRKRQARRYQVEPAEIALSESEWLARHPLGYLEHRQAFSPKGRYGRWLRRQPAAAKLGDTLFVHGGVTEILPDSVEAVNDRIATEIRQLDALRDYLTERGVILDFFDWRESVEAVERELEYQRSRPPALPALDESYQRHISLLEGFLASRSWLIHHPLGPLWNRNLALDPDTPETREKVGALLERYGVIRIVVGHTPQLEGILSRFDGRVVLIDTGMLTSAYPGGTPSALELLGGRLQAIYPARTEPPRVPGR